MKPGVKHTAEGGVSRGIVHARSNGRRRREHADVNYIYYIHTTVDRRAMTGIPITRASNTRGPVLYVYIGPRSSASAAALA